MRPWSACGASKTNDSRKPSPRNAMPYPAARTVSAPSAVAIRFASGESPAFSRIAGTFAWTITARAVPPRPSLTAWKAGEAPREPAIGAALEATTDSIQVASVENTTDDPTVVAQATGRSWPEAVHQVRPAFSSDVIGSLSLSD